MRESARVRLSLPETWMGLARTVFLRERRVGRTGREEEEEEEEESQEQGLLQKRQETGNVLTFDFLLPENKMIAELWKSS